MLSFRWDTTTHTNKPHKQANKQPYNNIRLLFKTAQMDLHCEPEKEKMKKKKKRKKKNWEQAKGLRS